MTSGQRMPYTEDQCETFGRKHTYDLAGPPGGPGAPVSLAYNQFNTATRQHNAGGGGPPVPEFHDNGPAPSNGCCSRFCPCLVPLCIGCSCARFWTKKKKLVAAAIAVAILILLIIILPIVLTSGQSAAGGTSAQSGDALPLNDTDTLSPNATEVDGNSTLVLLEYIDDEDGVENTTLPLNPRSFQPYPVQPPTKAPPPAIQPYSPRFPDALQRSDDDDVEGQDADDDDVEEGQDADDVEGQDDDDDEEGTNSDTNDSDPVPDLQSFDQDLTDDPQAVDSVTQPVLASCDVSLGFVCASGDQTVNSKKRCDAIKDCADGSDELNCKTCLTAVDCPLEADVSDPDKLCLRGAVLCDGSNDGCPTNIHDSALYCGRDCLPDVEFRCAGQSASEATVCILEAWLCDGEEQCPLGDDEVVCTSADHCQRGAVWCESSQRCLAQWLICDGKVDCPAPESAPQTPTDEDNCTCDLCHGDAVLCASPVGRCALPCDGTADCDDGADEVGCDTETHNQP